MCVYEQIAPQDHRVLELRLLHHAFHLLVEGLQGLIVTYIGWREGEETGEVEEKGRERLLTGMLGWWRGGSVDGVGVRVGVVAAKALRESMKSAHTHECD